MLKVKGLVLVALSGLTICILLMVIGGKEVIANRILHNILRCSSQLMSDCGFLPELDSSHCQSIVSYL